MKQYFYRFVVAGGLLAVPFAVSAVTLTNITIPLAVSTSSRNYTVSGTLTSLKVSTTTSITATIAASETLTIESPDKTVIDFPLGSTPPFTETCTGSTFSITFTNTSSGATQTFSMSPSYNTNCGSRTTTAASSGGSGGGSTSGSSSGGGGGGGTGTTGTTPTPAPTPVPAAAPASAAPQFTRDLEVGMSGNDISQLQALLAAQAGIYPEGLITGYFGPATRRAVQRFQEQNGLPSVGRVGPATRAKLMGLAGPAAPAPAPTPTPAAGALGGSVTRGLGRGANGSDVTLLQQLLAQDSSVYPEANISGYFGALTEAAVGRFQEKYGIAGPGESGYGYVGPKTRAKVNELLGSGAVPPAPPAATGMSADDAAKIKALQDQLKALQDQLKTMQ